MALKLDNITLVKFESRDVDGFELSAKLMKALVQTEGSIPIVFRVGKVDYKIGLIPRIRVGREVAFGDAMLELKGELEFEAIKDEDGTAIGAKPSKFVYKKEN